MRASFSELAPPPLTDTMEDGSTVALEGQVLPIIGNTADLGGQKVTGTLYK